MISRFRHWPHETPSPVLGYSIAVLLAAAAQAARIPLHTATLMPHISYVPFVVMSAAFGGFGPGLLATGLCILESMYFATEPVGSFIVGDPRLWGGLGALAFTGLVTCTLFDSLKRARRMLESIIQHSPAAIALLRGPEYKLAMVNPAYQALLPGEPLVGRTVASAWPTAAPEIVPILNVVRHTRTIYRAAGYALPVDLERSSQSDQRYFDFSYVPLDGACAEDDVDVLTVAIETTEHKRAEAALRAAWSQLAAIYANAPVVLLVIDEQLRVREANDLAARLAGREISAMAGLPPGGALGCVNALADPRGCGNGPSCGQCPLRLAIFDTLTNGTCHEGIEAWMSLSVGGQWLRRCLLASTTAMKVEDATRVLVCALDITERRRAEDALNQTVQQLGTALAEKTVLLQEIHHRVKNNLAVTASLLSMKADSSGPEARVALEESQQRVHSIALVHEHLYDHVRLDRINFGEYARELVQGVYSTFAGQQRHIGIDLELDPIELGIEQAVPCALILNELLSNAFKYAFAGGRAGRILVSFRRSDPGCFEMAVEDDGVGLPDGVLGGPNQSLGLRIVGILTDQLEGSIGQTVCPGTRVVLRFPAAA